MEATCLNCDTAFAGNYCPECGQKKDTHKITFTSILHDIPHSVFHVDKGFLFTFSQLLYRPGKAIREFVHGKRVNYFSPFAYLLLLCAATSFIDHITLPYLPAKMILGADAAVFPKVAIFFGHYPALLLCAFVPFLSFWSWLFNKEAGYNYWENFILNVYLMAQFTLFFIASRLVLLLFGVFYQKLTPLILCFLSYVMLAYGQFFPKPKGVAGFLSWILMFLLISITFLTCLSFGGIMTKWWWW